MAHELAFSLGEPTFCFNRMNYREMSKIFVLFLLRKVWIYLTAKVSFLRCSRKILVKISKVLARRLRLAGRISRSKL